MPGCFRTYSNRKALNKIIFLKTTFLLPKLYDTRDLHQTLNTWT